MSSVRLSGDALGTLAMRLASTLLACLPVLFLSFGPLPSRAAAATPSAENNPFAPTIQQVNARFGRIQQEVDRLRSSGQGADADRLAAALQHFRDQLAGNAPSQVAGSELDVVGAYGPGAVTVNVGPTDRPVVLGLSSYEGVHWQLNLQPGANLQKVLVSSHDAPTSPAGLPGNVPLETAQNGFFLFRKDYTSLPPAAQALNRLTGLPLTSLQGPTSGVTTAAFTVGDAGAEWAAQRVLTEMVPLYKDATASQLAQDRAAAAGYRFVARYNPTGGQFSRGGSTNLFSPLGPVAGATVGTPSNVKHVAFDPATSTYYGVASQGVPVQLGALRGGTATPLPDSPYEISWPTGLTFDTKRNRLVLSTLGGEGFLLGYSPDTKQWSMISSLNQVDLNSLTYSAADDAFYALDSGPGGSDVTPMRLLRYDAQGHPAGTIGLSEYIPTAIGYDAQLTATGDRLSLLTPAMPDLYDPLAPPQVRSYLIDPHTGVTTFLGTISIVPEPGSAALLLCGMGALLARRRCTE